MKNNFFTLLIILSISSSSIHSMNDAEHSKPSFEEHDQLIKEKTARLLEALLTATTQPSFDAICNLITNDDDLRLSKLYESLILCVAFCRAMTRKNLPQA